MRTYTNILLVTLLYDYYEYFLLLYPLLQDLYLPLVTIDTLTLLHP